MKLFLTLLFISITNAFDVTIVGHFNSYEGLGNVPIQIIESLKGQNIKINCIPIYSFLSADVSYETKK